MQDKNRVDKIVLQKIIEYCNDIEEALRDEFNFSYENYLTKKFVRYGCDTCVFQIGELTKHLSEEIKNEHSEIAWNKIKGLRNVYAHEYEKIDLEKIWETLTKNIPDLKEKLQKILSEMD